MIPGMAHLSLPVAELTSFDLPPVCLVTGSEAEVSFRRVKFVWSPRWIPLLIFFPYAGLLLALILTLVLRKRAAGELPFSPAGWERYRRGVWLTYAALLSLLLGIGGMIAFFASQQFETGLVAALAGVIGTIALHIVGTNMGISVRKITLGHLDLKIPQEAVALRFRDHLQGGRPVLASVAG